jgi:tRNA pseudouridine38-40 synthase
MERRGYALRLAYDGGAFHGWQRQPGVNTVQQVVEEGLAGAGVDARLAAAARTDRGVSARAQVVSFRSRQSLRLAPTMTALQTALPRSVRLLAWAEVGASFHARASAKEREYRYRLADSPERFDLDAARGFLASLLGEGDRTGYVWRPTRSVRSRVIAAEVRERPEGGLVLRFVADAFGRRLVRNWVWATLAAARGERCEGPTDRGWRGRTAPAEGLLLWAVRYDEDPFAVAAKTLQNLT